LHGALRLIKARLPNTVTLEEHIEDSGLIEGRPADISHAFINLLDNAARAVRDGGTIRVEASCRHGLYQVSIGDSGSGVDPALAERILEPFFTMRPAGEGTGLGLTIAQQAALECGGDLQVGRSALGGASFILRIPLVSMLQSDGSQASRRHASS
jgi:two-component system, NtrC family, sensor kinase